ncbi:hypothetical protein DPMN_152648 [Dreissena polymorpha]|uniref:Zinc finger PHD-type domain-containing protein n=1 Tax=Dreissena polymorpha TaxID=45954 RepID=A0A9D4FHU2_DREPO|nr:hypothetical protein DPMN_152648 [Dreissena polymorpha]
MRRSKAEDRKQKKEQERVQKEQIKTERLEKIRQREEEAAERKRARVEAVAEAAATAYLCAKCGERGRVDDEERGVEWHGCDGCECWYHGGCLTQNEPMMAVTSLYDGEESTCNRCYPWDYEEGGTVSMYLRLRARVKARVRVCERVREVVSVQCDDVCFIVYN